MTTNRTLLLIIQAARLLQSANTSQTGEILDKISSSPKAGGRFGHPGGELAGSGDVIRGKDGAEVRDERLLGSGRKMPSRAHLQSFDPSSPDRLIEVRRKDQRGHAGAQADARADRGDRAQAGSVV